MRKIIKIIFLLSCVYVLAGCSAYDKWTEDETMVDPDSGKVVNKKAIRSSERVEIAIDNKTIDIIKNASVIVNEENKEEYITDGNGKFLGIIYNPHPRLVQHILLTDPDGETIADEDLQPKEFREVYTFRPSGKDYHLIATWTLGRNQSTFDVLFPEGTAKCRDQRGKKCHFKTFGYGAIGF